ncbi:MAG TPA: DMT family transporter [Thermoanaerobaculia bacterium]|nr:DMT family transporter [Thermoanaerobaculia bacterium]
MAAPETASPAASPARSVHAALLSAQVFFGVFHVVAKAVLAHMEPLALAAVRVAIAAPVMVWIAWRHDRFVPERRDLPRLALLGGLGVFANQIFFIEGLRHTTAINASILMPSLPVFAVAAGALLGVEKVGARRVLGIALSVAGALVLVNPMRFSGDGRAALGNGLILLNCCCYAVFLVLQRPLLRRIPWRTVIAGAFVFGGAGVLTVSAPALARLQPGALPASAWWGVAYIVVFATVLAYAINTWAVRRSSPSLVAAYGTLQPLVAAVLAAAFLGEHFGWAEGLGFALILAGLWQVSARPVSASEGV